ncbi:MAG TPA: hypothetical protein VFB15_11740 [Candidatus Binataceae bacterium]|nr:hypothetical protein [Candidatus Binataceae bacterium]
MAHGIARWTATTQLFLDTCDAVTSWRALNKDFVEFEFDEEVEVPVVPPGVYFEPDEMDPETVHKHRCLECGRVIDIIALEKVECESVEDHDFALCADCAAERTE